MTILLLCHVCVVRYLFIVVHENRYQLRSSNNVPLLDFVTIDSIVKLAENYILMTVGVGVECKLDKRFV